MHTLHRRQVLLLVLLALPALWGCQPSKPAADASAQQPDVVLMPSTAEGGNGAADVAAVPADSALPAPADAPKITAVEAKFDFGKVKQGADVEHTFKIRNEGKSDLLLKGASSS